MSRQDFQDILEEGGLAKLPNQKKGGKKASLNPEESQSMKKPQGMSRELYSILSDEKGLKIASVMPTYFASKAKLAGYCTEKARLGSKKARKWIWSPLVNRARADADKGTVLYRWCREDLLDKPYYFEKFNRKLEILTYNDEDYNRNLVVSNWSREETDHLMELCRTYDLRWFVIHSRWDRDKFGSSKSMEDMKERYYNLCNILTKLRSSEPVDDSKLLCFDADNERRRKEQMTNLYNRTKEEVEEEKMLIVEHKKIQQRKRDRERKAQDLQKLISAADRGEQAGIPATPAGAGPAAPQFPMTPASVLSASSSFQQNKRKVSKIAPMTPLADQPFTGIKFLESRAAAGPLLRSSTMKIPSNLGKKKGEVVGAVLDKLKLEIHPMATEEISRRFNDLRSDVALLYELKSALSSMEYELESRKVQYEEETGQELQIPSKCRASQPVDSRKICEVIESGPILAGAAAVSRKRKSIAPVPESPVQMKKLRKSQN